MGALDDEPEELTTQELRVVASKREQHARKAAEGASSDEETAQHDRRAQKSAYLKEKLEERERAERELE